MLVQGQLLPIRQPSIAEHNALVGSGDGWGRYVRAPLRWLIIGHGANDDNGVNSFDTVLDEPGRHGALALSTAENLGMDLGRTKSRWSEKIR